MSLDKTLEEKGYDKVTPTNVMTAPLSESKTFFGKSVITNKITEEWQKNCFKLIGISDDLTANTAKTIQNNIVHKTLCALIIQNGVIAACGLCVVEREYAGLFYIKVDVNYRRKGLGFDICNSLLSNAVKLGAKYSYLQVVADNAPAVALYNKMGFTDCYQYWYRVKKQLRREFFAFGIASTVTDCYYETFTLDELSDCTRKAGFKDIESKRGFIYTEDDGTILHCKCRK